MGSPGAGSVIRAGAERRDTHVLVQRKWCRRQSERAPVFLGPGASGMQANKSRSGGGAWHWARGKKTHSSLTRSNVFEGSCSLTVKQGDFSKSHLHMEAFPKESRLGP